MKLASLCTWMCLVLSLCASCSTGPPKNRPNVGSLNPVYWGYGNYCGKYNPLISEPDESARLSQYLDLSKHGKPVDHVDWACYVHDVCSEENGGELGGGLTSQCNMQMWVDLYSAPITNGSPKHCEAIRNIVGQLFVTSRTPGDFWYEAGGETVENASKIVTPFLLLNTYRNVVWDNIVRNESSIECFLGESDGENSNRLSDFQVGFFRSEVRNRALADHQWLTFIYMSLRTSKDAGISSLAEVVYPLFGGSVFGVDILDESLHANPLNFEHLIVPQEVPELVEDDLQSAISFGEHNTANASVCIHEMSVQARYSMKSNSKNYCDRDAFYKALSKFSNDAMQKCDGFRDDFKQANCGDRYDFYSLWIQALDHIRKIDSNRITRLYFSNSDDLSPSKKLIREIDKEFDASNFRMKPAAVDLRVIGLAAEQNSD